MNIQEQAYWNSRAYGSAIIFRKNIVRSIFIVVCLITPATNWLIPFTRKLVKRDIKITYGG